MGIRYVQYIATGMYELVAEMIDLVADWLLPFGECKEGEEAKFPTARCASLLI